MVKIQLRQNVKYMLLSFEFKLEINVWPPSGLQIA